MKLKDEITKTIKDKLDKKVVTMTIVLFIAFIISMFLYSKNGDKTTQEDIMTSIFVEEDSEEVGNEYSNEDRVTSRASNETKEINKDIEESKQIGVEIRGEVVKPDVYYVDEGTRIVDLIKLAGGLTENAYINNINKAQILKDEDCVNITNKNEENANINNIVENNTNSIEINAVKGSSNMEGKININTATLEEFNELQGIGDTKAKAIIEYRDKNGAFKTIEDIKNVKGIGEKTFENIKDSIST